MLKYDAIVVAPFGAVGILVAQDNIAGLDFLPQGTVLRAPTHALAAETARQVERYLSAPDFRFDLPLAEAGTPFQRRVWRQIAAIAPGRTTTYGQLAAQLGSSPRAVGGACGANPYPLVTPCHRVLPANGGLGGFSGRSGDAAFLLGVKRWLLAHEGMESAL